MTFIANEGALKVILIQCECKPWSKNGAGIQFSKMTGILKFCSVHFEVTTGSNVLKWTSSENLEFWTIQKLKTQIQTGEVNLKLVPTEVTET